MTSMQCRHGNWPYECPDCLHAVERVRRESTRDALLFEVSSVVADLAESRGINPTRIRELLARLKKGTP